MSKWIHLKVYFKNFSEISKDAIQEKPKGAYKKLISYLKEIVDSLSPNLIMRFYFLFEGNIVPLFLALELKDESIFPEVKEKIGNIKRPDFIESSTPDLNIEVKDPEEAINFYQVGSKYAFHRISNDYNPPWHWPHDLVHLVHCFSNQIFVNWINEAKFYADCLQGRLTLLQKIVIDSEKQINE